MEMETSIDTPTIGLTSSTCDSQIEIATTENDETFSIARYKIGCHGLQQYFKNFKEYITGEHKGKISPTCKLVEETLWHLRQLTSNYRSRTGFQWKFERIGVELKGVGVEI